MTNGRDERSKESIAYAMQLIVASGIEGITAGDLGNALVEKFGGKIELYQVRILRLAKNGKIFKKKVVNPRGSIQNRYFVNQADCDAYVVKKQDKTSKEYKEYRRQYQRERYSIDKAAGVLRHQVAAKERQKNNPRVEKPKVTKPKTLQLIGEAIIPEHVKITVCPPFQGDYRIRVDAGYRGEWSREWDNKRSGN